jgi:hypothetical protein
LFALLGRFNVSDKNEQNWVQKNISTKIIHPDYKHKFYHRMSDADIALLIMESPVEFTNYIQPICLPSSDQNVFNVRGIVAGYGRTGRYEDPTEVPYQINLYTDNLLDCYDIDKSSTQYVSKRSFCASHPTAVLCAGLI